MLHGGVTGKPATYTPSSHTHTISNITDLQTNLDKKLPLSGGTVYGNLTFPDIGDNDSSRGLHWAGSGDGAWIYYKTTGKDKGHLAIWMDDDADTTIDFMWNIGGTVDTKSYISSDGVYHGTATYANSAGSANAVAWANVNSKPELAYVSGASNLPSSYTGGDVWKAPS